MVIVIPLVFLFFTETKEPFSCLPYSPLKNYSVDTNHYQFTKNTEAFTFAVINSECIVQRDDISKDIFENYFVLQYALAVEKTPRTIKDIEDAVGVVIDLIEKPFEDVNSTRIEDSIQKLKNFMNVIPRFKPINNFNKISCEYKSLHNISDLALRDEELSPEEVKDVRKQTSKFMYTFLDGTNQVQGFVGQFVESDLIKILFKLDGLLKKFKFYREKREEIITIQIEKILFDIPIKFIFKNLNK
ncbi:MAG: hypothetical protein KAR87_03695 [Candidatus Aenigmarchaeota archaeon]|nr:hypothetical protein [Candidatus Aenigmarchaeota archaeon]